MADRRVLQSAREPTRALVIVAFAAWLLAATAARGATPPVIDVSTWRNDNIDKALHGEVVNTAEFVFDPESLRLPDGNGHVRLKLPGGTDDKEVDVVFVKEVADNGSKNVFFWTGHDQHNQRSSATFTIVDNVVSGTIILADNRIFKLRWMGDNKYRIDQIDPAKLPRPGTPDKAPASPDRPAGVPPPAASPAAQPPGQPQPRADQPPTQPPADQPPAAPAPAGNQLPAGHGHDAAGAVLPHPPPPPAAPGAEAPQPAVDAAAQPQNVGGLPGNVPAETDGCPADSGNRIDLLVAYTGGALADRGGRKAQIEGDICIAEIETNRTFRESGLQQQVRIVGMEPVTFRETTSTQLVLDSMPVPGPFDAIRQQRDSLGADIVVTVMVSNENCGLANPMPRIDDPDFKERAFAVVPIKCLNGGYALAHEIGHVMGARHDLADDPSPGGVFAFNHGYIQMHPASGGPPWFTVMGTTRECDDAGRKDCQRIPRWSDPRETLPNGDKLGDAEKSDEVKTLENTAPIVAKFRCSKSGVEGACIVR